MLIVVDRVFGKRPPFPPSLSSRDSDVSRRPAHFPGTKCLLSNWPNHVPAAPRKEKRNASPPLCKSFWPLLPEVATWEDTGGQMSYIYPLFEGHDMPIFVNGSLGARIHGCACLPESSSTSEQGSCLRVSPSLIASVRGSGIWDL